MKILVETSVTSCFVAPAVCKQLVDAGLWGQVPFQWKIYNEVAKLCTHEFDIDDYYKDGIKHQDFISPPGQILPAYNIKDLERLLPAGYLLTLNNSNDEYELRYRGQGCVADRMPDAFAMLFLQLIKNHVIDLHRSNTIMSR